MDGGDKSLPIRLRAVCRTRCRPVVGSRPMISGLKRRDSCSLDSSGTGSWIDMMQCSVASISYMSYYCQSFEGQKKNASLPPTHSVLRPSQSDPQGHLYNMQAYHHGGYNIYAQRTKVMAGRSTRECSCPRVNQGIPDVPSVSTRIKKTYWR